MLKVMLGYHVEDGVTPEEYERWLYDIHVPDLLANPHLDKVVLNKIVGQVETTSSGNPVNGESYYRISELHFADEAAYRRYNEWFAANPVPDERGAKGRTRFGFYLIAESEEFTR